MGPNNHNDTFSDTPSDTPHEATLYEKTGDGKVTCNLCNFRCHIADGKRGVCGVRENRGGTLLSLVYGRVIAAGSDPVEKKPLFHFLPGTTSYSISTVGCNFRCLHCQNYHISQMPKKDEKIIAGERVGPKEVVSAALREECRSISYTYTEPTIFFEYAEDCAILAKERGLRNFFVTNGYMTSECVSRMTGLIDAANVDLKSFDDATYKSVCGARLAPVLESIEKLRAAGIWVEVTTLVIPTVNDSEEELRSIAKWLFKTDPAMPWHISAFYPTYKLTDAPPTPVETLDRAREIGLAEGLRYVYTGNVPGDPGESTYCYGCGELLISRVGFRVLANNLTEGNCPKCGKAIDGVWL